jgi:hypothetical protein
MTIELDYNSCPGLPMTIPQKLTDQDREETLRVGNTQY